MAVVIPFALHSRSIPASVASPASPAEILFFTGVRYDRAAEAEAARLAPAVASQTKRRGTVRTSRAKSAGQPA